MNLSLRLLLLVLVAAVPVLLVQVHDELQTRALRREASSAQLVTLARLGAARVDRLAELARGVLVTAAHLPAIRTRVPRGCAEDLRGLHRQLPDIAEFRLVSAAGQTICSSGPAVGPTGEILADLLRSSLAAEGVAATASFGPEGWRGITFARAIGRGQDAEPSIMLVSIGGARLSVALGEVRLPEGADIILLDRTGAALARAPAVPAEAAPSPKAGELRAALEQGRESAQIGASDEEGRLVGFARLGSPAEMTVAATMPRAQLFAETEMQFLQKMALLGTVFLLAALLALLGGEISVRRPILALRRAVRQVEWGDLAARPRLGSGGIRELARLNESFNAMATAVQAHERELRAAKEEAERAQQAADLARIESDRARKEAEAATAAKTRFIAAASHDLRQPFQAMRLFMHILDGRLTDPESREIAGHLDGAMRSGEDMLTALLDVAILESGSVRPQISTFAVGALIQRIAAEFRPLAANKGLVLRVRSSSLSVSSDPLLLERILRNLLSNAVRYTERGRILVGCRRRGSRLRLEVWDTGPGIPADQQSAIFEGFYQVDGNARDHAQGVGLGLSIVRRLARILDHRLDLRSRPEHGSVFSVDMPIADAPESAPSEPRASVRLAGFRIVLLEDDAAQRIAVKHILGQAGCTVTAASSLEAALVALQDASEAPHLVLTDFRLPGHRNGTDAIRRIGEAFGRRLPGVILTGEMNAAEIRDAAGYGYAVLQKPIDPARLVAVLETALAP